MHLRHAAPFVLAAVLVGCPEKKPAEPEPPKQATAVVEAPKPPPPPEVKEPRAEAECAAPIELKPPTEVKIGDRTATSKGYKLVFADKDSDGALTLGVLGPLNEDSGANMLAVRKYLKFFQDEKVDAIVVTGDSGEVADGIARILKPLAATKLPLFVIAGNRECRAEYTDGVNQVKKEFTNVVNMNEVRAVEFPEATLVSLPGYHDPNYLHCATGCRYYKSTVDEVVRLAKEAKSPVVLVAHDTPRGEGSQALDYARDGNVGDPEINRAIAEANIPFGVFSNIKEAGARATLDPAGTTQHKVGAPAKTLYLNPGPADAIGWEMNDGSKSVGLAATLTIKDGQASYKLFRNKPLTAAEKAEAKKLEPPPRPDGEPAEGEKTASPTPPPGEASP